MKKAAVRVNTKTNKILLYNNVINFNKTSLLVLEL